VSRRQNLVQHRESLTEIREIMNSMKTLAYMETRKLAPYLDTQSAVVRTIEEVAADFLTFYPDVVTTVEPVTSLLILVGSERGFCGDFNRALFNSLDADAQQAASGPELVIAVGAKLHILLEEDPRMIARVSGASTSEEIATVLNRLVEQIVLLERQHGALRISCRYHAGEDQPVTRTLLPPFRDFDQVPSRFTIEPVVNITPEKFFLELSDQYLLAALHAILYSAMMTENNYRVRHLDGAVRHIDGQAEELARQSNALRQEEIIEEIEVILLSAESVTEELAGDRR